MVVKPVQQVLQISLPPAGGGDWAKPSLSRGSAEKEGTDWPQIISGTQYPAPPPPNNTLQPELFTHQARQAGVKKPPHFSPL